MAVRRVARPKTPSGTLPCIASAKARVVGFESTGGFVAQRFRWVPSHVEEAFLPAGQVDPSIIAELLQDNCGAAT